MNFLYNCSIHAFSLGIGLGALFNRKARLLHQGRQGLLSRIEQQEKVKRALKLPDEVMPACMLVFGYPTQQQKERVKPARFHRDYIVHKNVYHTMSTERHRAFFEERAQRNNAPIVDFEAQVEAFWRRKYESEFSNEMNRSAKAYFKTFDKE